MTVAPLNGIDKKKWTLSTSSDEIIIALTSTSYCVILANLHHLGFSYLLSPCSTFSELENYSSRSSGLLVFRKAPHSPFPLGELVNSLDCP